MQLNKRLLRQDGVTLIEVLIAMLVLSVGILAMAAAQGAAVKYTKVAQFKGIAVQIGYDLVDRMRANRNGNYTYTEDYDSDDDEEIVLPDCDADAAANCTAAQIAAMDLGQIRLRLREALPGGGVRIVPNAGAVDIFIIWQTPDAPGSDDDDTSAILPCPDAIGGPDATQCLSMRVVL